MLSTPKESTGLIVQKWFYSGRSRRVTRWHRTYRIKDVNGKPTYITKCHFRIPANRIRFWEDYNFIPVYRCERCFSSVKESISSSSGSTEQITSFEG